MVDFWFGFYFVCAPEMGAKLGQLLPLIYSFFFSLKMHFGDGNGDFFQYVCAHKHLVFCEAFIVYSLFLHSDVNLVKFKM